MVEQWSFCIPILQESHQQIAHFGELSEDEYFLIEGEYAVKFVEEKVGLAAQGRIELTVLQKLGGVIADLFQDEDHLQYDTLSPKQRSMIFPFDLSDGRQRLIQCLLV